MTALPAWLGSSEQLGPLHHAARRFLVEERADIEALVRGAPTLAWLARRIDSFGRRDASARDEAQFIEGAGAVLGAVLVDHVGTGKHVMRDGVHRVKLGAYSFFDPFAAIERALDAPNIRLSLVEDIGRAEAEAGAHVGVGRVMSAFLAMLASERPDASLVDTFEMRIWLQIPSAGEGAVEVDIARVVVAAEGQSEEAVQQAVKKLIDMLPGGAGTAVTREEAIERLLPRIVGPSFELHGALFGHALPHGVLLSLVLAYEGRSRFVRVDEIASWSMTDAEAIEAALTNLSLRSERARFVRTEYEDGPVLSTRTGDGLDSARLVLPSLYEAVGAQLGVPFLACVPHRDALLACSVNAPIAREAMLTRVREDHARAPHAISDQVFLVTETGLVAV